MNVPQSAQEAPDAPQCRDVLYMEVPWDASYGAWGTFIGEGGGGRMAGMSGLVLVEELRGIVGDAQVLSDPDVVAPYAVDWSRRFAGPVLAVVRPADTSQVSAVVRAC